MTQTITDTVLTGMVAYGPPVFGLILLLGAAGLPLPTSLVVIAAGAFGQQGVFEPWSAMLWGMAGVIAGDSISYGLGRYAGAVVEKRLSGTSLWESAKTMFSRKGGAAIFLTRFLLTAIAFPVNIIAGGSRYRFYRFLTWVIAGEAVWIASYGGIGYFFGDRWEEISAFISDSTGLLLGLLTLGLGLYAAFRPKKKRS